MDNQVPKKWKERFKQLLNTVNTISNERIGRFKGQVKNVLVEEINKQDNKLVTGKTEENITVHFEGDVCLIGKIVPVLLNENKGFYYIGERINTNE